MTVKLVEIKCTKANHIMANTFNTDPCPICYEPNDIRISICGNKHFICLDCFESYVCKIYINLSVFSNDFAVKPQSCPMCRQGTATVLKAHGDTIGGVLHFSSLEMPQTAAKWKPCKFRGRKFNTPLAAVQWWQNNFRAYYECVACHETVTLNPGIPLSYVIDMLGKTCTLCCCGQRHSREAAFYHFNVMHGTSFGPRFSQRLATRARDAFKT